MLDKTIKVYKLLSPSLQRSLIVAVCLSIIVALLDVASIYIVYKITQVFVNKTSYEFLGVDSYQTLYFLIILFFIVHCSAKLALVYQTQRGAFLSGWWLGRVGFQNLINSNFKNALDFESATTSLVHRSSSVVQNILVPLLNVAASIISIFIIITYLLSLSITFVLTFLVLLLSTYIIVYFLMLPIMRKTGSEITRRYESTLSIVKDVPGFLAEVKIYNLGAKAVENYSNEDLNLRRAEIVAQFVGNLIRPIVETLALLGIILYLLISFNNQSASQSQDFSLSISVLFGCLRLIPYLQSLYLATSSVKTHIALLDDFLKLFKNVDHTKKTRIDTLTNIKVSDAQVHKLDDTFKFDFNFKQGHKYMIVGPSGSGKSSILKDICQVGFRDTKVTFNDKEYINPDLASVISYVPQKIFLYTGSLLDNLTLDDKDVNTEKLKTVLKLSKCDAFLASTEPHALRDVRISSSKDIFSGGQLKRIAIARALYRNTNWILLDEATSGLDSALELEIIQNITSQKKSIVLVTHNRALSNYFDTIIDLGKL